MPVWVAAAIALAAVTATYFSCIRPHLRGSDCGMTGSGTKQSADTERQIAELREELRVLRAQDALDARGGQPSNSLERFD